LLYSITKLSLAFCFFINANGCFNTETILENDRRGAAGFAIKGISVVAPVKPVNETALQPVVNVHANSIALMPYAFCNPENPVIKYNHKGGWWGESDDGIIGCIQLAHKKKLTVMLKPHLWIAHGMYTGEFALHTENEWQLWEDSYLNYIVRFAHIADSLKAEIFCIGTELGASIKERPQFWNSLIDTLKQTYSGKLTYAGNWDDYKNFPFWQKLDYIGVDAYFPLAAEKTPSVNALNKGWKKYGDELNKVSIKHNRPVLFTEYGYRNVDYTGAEPWKENEGNQNDKAQANALEAFYESFAGKKWIAGGFIWKWYADSARHDRDKIDFTPQNKRAEKVIAKWYKD
jgi:hypothetical protein